jgi:type VI secretion system protein
MLKLTLISLPPLPSGTPETRCFSEQEIVVGRGNRSEGLHWTLKDPDKELSRRHFVIRLLDGVYWIEDRSTNGVTFNDHTLLERHCPVRLNEGDRIRLGHYQFTVSFDNNSTEERADSTDPFSLFDEPADGLESAESAAGPSPVTRRPAPVAEPLPDLFASPKTGDLGRSPPPVLDFGAPEPRRPASESDHVPGIQAFFAPPVPQSAAPPDRFPPPAPPATVEATNDDPFAFLNDFDLPPAAPATPRPASIPAPPVRDVAPSPPAERRPSDLVPGPVPSAGRPAASPTPTPPVANTATASDAALQAFLFGAGIDPASITDTDGLAILTRAGQMLRESIDGLITILNARNMIKSTLRMERTVLQPVDNNPLKFSSNTEDTLISLLDCPRPGFMDPSVATRGAAQDILAHEIALVGAMQIALNNLLERFRPENLTVRIQADHPLGAVLPAVRKARYWELYERDYRKIADDMANNFNGVFGDALTDAYQKQLARLELDDDTSLSVRPGRK